MSSKTCVRNNVQNKPEVYENIEITREEIVGGIKVIAVESKKPMRKSFYNFMEESIKYYKKGKICINSCKVSPASIYKKKDARASNINKPLVSYVALISSALQAQAGKVATLSRIYQWISENYDYYNLEDNSWKGSIRHNLSLSKRFERIPKRDTDGGKGGLWRLKEEIV